MPVVDNQGYGGHVLYRGYNVLMFNAVIIVLICLSTHRITRLITRDAFPPAVWFRTKIEDLTHSEHWLAYLTQCDWCASIWVASGISTVLGLIVANVLHASWWPWPIWILVALTASSVTGLIAQREPE